VKRKSPQPDASGAAVLTRLEWFDRPEFAPADETATRPEPRHARIAQAAPRRRRLRLRIRSPRRLLKATVILAVSAGLVVGLSTLRLRKDEVAAPHDPVTLGLHAGSPAHVARAGAAARKHKAPVTAKAAPKQTSAAKPKAAADAKAGPKPAVRTAPIPPVPVQLPTFTWTPVPGATGYEFQLFRDSVLLYTARTPKASLTVPPAWTVKGRLVRVTPGTYRWYVWPLAGETRQEPAIVQAKLTVGG
jgi:hypothetical protein